MWSWETLREDIHSFWHISWNYCSKLYEINLFFFFLTHPSRNVYILTPAKCSPFSLFFSYRNLSLYHSFASIIVYYSFSIPSVSLILLPLLLFFFFVLCLSRVGDSLKPLHWCNSIESCFQDMSLTVGIL